MVVVLDRGVPQGMSGHTFSRSLYDGVKMCHIYHRKRGIVSPGQMTSYRRSLVNDALSDEEYLALKTVKATWSPPERYFIGDTAVNQPWTWVHTVGYGWPFVSLCVDYDQGYYDPPPESLVLSGIGLGSFGTISGATREYPKAIPTRVVWIGLFGNVFLTAFSGWLVFRLVYEFPLSIKRKKRWKLGACGRCGYSVGDSNLCPECGAERPSS